MNTKCEFWLVYREGQGNNSPTYEHTTSASARNEAARLAMQHRGVRFFVLRAEYGLVMPVEEPQMVRIEGDDTPF